MKPQAQWWQPTGNEEKPRSYVEVVKDSTNEEEIECHPKQPLSEVGPTERPDLRRTAPSSVPRYGHFFYGYCFTCGKFEHKVVNCFQRRNFETRNNPTRLGWPQYNNKFGPLRSEIECYKCNNFGHIAIDCIMKIPTVRNEERSNNQKGEHHKVWIKHKDNLNNYECGIALQAQNNNFDEWYVDSGCSKHMTGNKSAFNME